MRECCAPVAPGSGRRVLVNLGVARITKSLLGTILVARSSLDRTQGLGGGTSHIGYSVHVAGTRSLSSCTAAGFGVDEFFGPRRQDRISYRTAKWGFRVLGPSKVLLGTIAENRLPFAIPFW